MSQSQSEILVSQNAGNNEASSNGAAPEVPSLPYQLQYEQSPPAIATNSAMPPESPALEKAEPDGAQYATYRPEEVAWGNADGADIKALKLAKGWVPLPLRAYFWIPLVIFMILLAIGLEVALRLNTVNDGWPAWNATNPSPGFANYYHYAYTEPPVIVGMTIVGLWAWVDIEMKKLQPYIDLAHGHALPERSLLLDYTRENKFLVWIAAFWNRHYMVGIITLISLLVLVVQPLSSSLFVLKPTLWSPSEFNVTNLASISLNEGPVFQDLTAFLSAAGYASSSVLYNLGNVSFVHDAYTVAPFQIPTTDGTHGIVNATTTAIKSDTNCYLMTTDSTEIAGGGWLNHATYDGCTFSYSVGATTSHLFGTNVMPDCNNTGLPDYVRPIVFWFFTYDTNPPQGSATFCAPSISLLDVAVTVDIDTGNLTSVQEIGPFNSTTSPFSSLSGNVTGAPLNGRAFNGIVFNLTNPDQFTIQRSNATDLQLPASILQAASTAPGGLAAAFQTNSFVEMATEVYGIYLGLIAKTVYFLPKEDPILVQVQSYQQRLWLSNVAVHMMVFVLIVVALVGAFVEYFHHDSRRNLHLRNEPGTIASAISIGGETNVAHLLNSPQQQGDLAQILHNRRFRIDPQTMKIVMEGEDGFEQAVSPNARHSIFGSWGSRP